MEDFVAHGPLVRLVLPPIRFLFVGSRVCSTLPSDGPSRDLICPCASLALRLHQAVQGTFTPKLLNMPDTPRCRLLRRLKVNAYGGRGGEGPNRNSATLSRNIATLSRDTAKRLCNIATLSR